MILSYISASTYGIIDDISFTGSDAELSDCKATLQKIFFLMGQEQHYNMMMKRH